MILLLLLLLNLSLTQEDITGIYKNPDESKITFKRDGTFTRIDYSHLTKYWSHGRWQFKNDTIYTKSEIIFDTIRLANQADKIFLSCDPKADVIVLNNDGELLRPVCDSMQNSVYKNGSILRKYFYKDRKIYNIDLGSSQLITTSPGNYYTKGEYNPTYIKVK